MKIIYLSILLCFSSLLIHSQNVGFDWAKSMGGIEWDEGNGMAIDGAGNVFVTGYFYDTVDFDPGPNVFNLIAKKRGHLYLTRDVFIQKLDAAGNFIWAKSIGGNWHDDATSIALDSKSNVYITGRFADTADFDPDTSVYNLIATSSYSNSFVLKLDANGTFVWAKSNVGNALCIGHSITVDPLGNVLSTGQFDGNIDFDPGTGTHVLSTIGFNDFYIQKLDSNGNFIWAKSISSYSNKKAAMIKADQFGNVVITGSFRDTVDFNPGSGVFNLNGTPSSFNAMDIFILKLDAGGAFAWAKSMGVAGNDEGNALRIDNTGFVYSTGKYEGLVDFDPGLDTFLLPASTYGGVNAYIQKLDPNGDFVWAKAIRGSAIGLGITLDAGGVYTTGHFAATTDFDPDTGIFHLTATNNQHTYIQKLDTGGNFVWAIPTQVDIPRSIETDGLGSVFLTGRFDGYRDFNPGISTYYLYPNGQHDAFVLKLAPCSPDVIYDSITACDSYTWIDGMTYTSSNYTAIKGYENASGCDSTIHLNLTLNRSESRHTLDTIMVCDSFVYYGYTYYWTTNLTQHYTNSVGCDSFLNLHVIVTKLDRTVNVYDPELIAVEKASTYQWLDCDNNYAKIPGATAREFTPNKNGNYAVVLSKNNCTDTSKCAEVYRVGLEERLMPASFSIFPNPSNGIVNVKSNSKKTYSIRVVDVSNKIVYEQNNVTSPVYQFELQADPGFYLVELYSQSERQFFKLLKN